MIYKCDWLQKKKNRTNRFVKIVYKFFSCMLVLEQFYQKKRIIFNKRLLLDKMPAQQQH